MLPLVIAVLLAISALMAVMVPLFATSGAATEPDGPPVAALVDRERAARDALHDVEFDYQLGNLDEADYRALRERYTRRALAALKGRHDRERAVDEAIEQQVRALRAGKPGDAKAGGSANGATPKAAPTRPPRGGPPNRAKRNANGHSNGATHHQRQGRA